MPFIVLILEYKYISFTEGSTGPRWYANMEKFSKFAKREPANNFCFYSTLPYQEQTKHWPKTSLNKHNTSSKTHCETLGFYHLTLPPVYVVFDIKLQVSEYTWGHG